MHICACICVYISKYINATCDIYIYIYIAITVNATWGIYAYNSNYCKKKEAIDLKESKEFVGEFGGSK